jgi:hypothetical protein
MYMNNNVKWIHRQVRLGWIFLAAGIILAVVGIVLQRLVANLPFNARIITGLGILLLGVAISYLVRYGAARRSPQAAVRLASEERDERMRIIRARAGNRAYWFSAVLAYAGLMWVSFAQSGSLPMLSVDALWYFLVGLVILPFGVYAASMMHDQQNG